MRLFYPTASERETVNAIEDGEYSSCRDDTRCHGNATSSSRSTSSLGRVLVELVAQLCFIPYCSGE